MNAPSLVVIGGQAGIVAVATAIPPDPEPTFGPTFWATVGLIVTTLITSVIGVLFQAWKEARDRRWRIEDARAKETIRQVAENTKDELAQKIDANTEISVRAFEAANNLNEKMLRTQQAAAAAARTVAEAANVVKRATETKP